MTAMQPVPCIGCGKVLFAGPGDAGQRMYCHACGTTMNAPLIVLPPAGQTWTSMRRAVEDDAARWQHADAAGGNGFELPAPVLMRTEAPPRGSGSTVSAPGGPHPAHPITKLERDLLFWRRALATSAGVLAGFMLVVLVGVVVMWDRLPKKQSAQNAVPGTQPSAKVAPATKPVAVVPRVVNPETKPVVAARPPEPPPVVEIPATKPAEVVPTPPVETVRNVEPPPQPRVENPPAVAVRPVVRTRPPVQAVPLPPVDVTDEEIGQAITRAADFLLAQFDERQLRQISGDNPDARETGLNALCVYALLQAGQATNDERLNVRGKLMKALVDRMCQMPIQGTTETYARGIRATALAVYNRPEDRQTLKDDLQWLIGATRNGGYTYSSQSANFMPWDNSNSQYGLLGAWSAAEVGGEVPSQYWRQVQNHWYETQLDDGQWSYGAGRGSGTLSMTVAGIASLFVTHDYIDAARFGSQVGREPFSVPLARGLKWLETGDNVLRLTGMGSGYTLYGIERVGLASGFKYFGEHDWYRVIAGVLVDQQAEDGSFGRINVIQPRRPGERGVRMRGGGRADLVETAYCLLFLARGRHPVLMNKLRWEGQEGKDGFWANRPRDLSNLTRFASRELERPLNWQVVPLSRDWTDWTDSPILYLASHTAVPMDDAEVAKVRSFIDAGGMLFLHADGGSNAFNVFASALARRLYPNLEWSDVPDGHEMFSINFKISPRPRLKAVSNGARILVLYSPEDLAQYWQIRADKTKRPVFEFGVNLFLYASGRGDLKNRLASPVLPPPQAQPTHPLRLARVKYAGQWDPEPAAFGRFARQLQYQTGYGLDVAGVPMRELDAARHPVAHLTGAQAYTPTDAEVTALKAYVESGGMLLIDACGGSTAFATSISGLLPRAFPNAKIEPLADSHPVYKGEEPGMDKLPAPLLRPYAERQVGRKSARIDVVRAGKGRVLYSPLDLTTGLLGTNTWGIAGYRPSYAQSLLKNVLLWAADGAPE